MMRRSPGMMRWTAPATALKCHNVIVETSQAGAAQMKLSIVGLDLAKSLFAVHGLDEDSRVAVRRELRRAQVLPFFARCQPCLIGMEACAGAHYWARELSKLGHQVRLMPASYVKAYVKRGKTDAADAEAICEAVSRPTMRFVPVKSAEQQSVLSLHRSRDLLVRQRTQTVNVLRSLCAEFGVAAGRGKTPLSGLQTVIANANDERLCAQARLALLPLLDQIQHLSHNIAMLERRIVARHRSEEASKRLETIPGIGPITASALTATLGDPSRFSTGRDLAAWIGLTPRALCSGGRQKLGHISKQGDPYLRRLLVQGASAVIRAARNPNARVQPWLRQLLARRPTKVAIVALANKLARIAWAILVKGSTYRVPQTANP
jgi:transposase